MLNVKLIYQHIHILYDYRRSVKSFWSLIIQIWLTIALEQKHNIYYNNIHNTQYMLVYNG